MTGSEEEEEAVAAAAAAVDDALADDLALAVEDALLVFLASFDDLLDLSFDDELV
jgi:hypothetical protein